MRRVRLRDDVIASRRTRLTPIGDTMKKIALAAALLALTGAASAQLNNKAYIGGAFGPSEVSVECGFPYNCDSTDTGYKLYAGFKVHPQVAIEAGYIDFGKAQVNLSSANVGSLATDGFVVNAAGRLPLTRELNAVGRLGLAFLETKGSGRFVANRTDSSTSAYLGLGLEYAFNKNIKGSAAADFSTGEFNGSEGSVRLLSIGVQYDF